MSSTGGRAELLARVRALLDREGEILDRLTVCLERHALALDAPSPDESVEECSALEADLVGTLRSVDRSAAVLRSRLTAHELHLIADLDRALAERLARVRVGHERATSRAATRMGEMDARLKALAVPRRARTSYRAARRSGTPIDINL